MQIFPITALFAKQKLISPHFSTRLFFFQKIVVARDKTVYLHHVDGTFFLITVTLARFRIIKKIKKAETRLCRREREREREKTHDREIGVIAIVCVCVRVIWNVAADFAGTAPRIFLSLGKRVWFSPWKGKRKTARTHHESTHPRVLGNSPDHERPPSRFLALGAGSFGMATGRGTGHLLSATPLDSNRVETTRPRLPVKPTCILVSTGLVESSFPSPRCGGPYSIKFA